MERSLRDAPRRFESIAVIGDRSAPNYNVNMERKVFWIAFIVLGVLADILLPIWWALFATIPIAIASWWIAYRSDWF